MVFHLTAPPKALKKDLVKAGFMGLTIDREDGEAEALTWVALDELTQLDLDVDRMAVAEYLRVYRGADALVPPGHQGEMEEAEETVDGEERSRDGQ